MKKHIRKIVWTATVAATIASASAVQHFNAISNQADSISRQNVSHGVLAEIYPIVSGVVNPDITSQNISQNLCNKNWSTKSIRPSTSYTSPLKVTDLAIYNQKFGTTYQLKDGELDHLISIELGGSPTDPNNLWFEPYITQVNRQQVGAHEKDSVENALHKELCASTKTLQEVQTIIITDWYSYWKTNIASKLGGMGTIIDLDDQ